MFIAMPPHFSPTKITGTVLCVIDTENTHANNGTDREWKRFGGAVLFIGFPTAVGKWPEGPIGSPNCLTECH